MGFDDRIQYMFDNMERIIKKIIKKYPMIHPNNNCIPEYILFHTNKRMRYWYGKEGLQDIQPISENETCDYSSRFFFKIEIKVENDGTYVIILDDLFDINPQFSYLCVFKDDLNRSRIVYEYLEKILTPYYNKVMYL